MNETVAIPAGKPSEPGRGEREAVERNIVRTRSGKIKIKGRNRSQTAITALCLVLLAITAVAFATFDTGSIDFGQAVLDTLHNIRTVFLEPELVRDTVGGVLYQLLVTFCLGILSTIIGAVLAFFCSLLCARNIAHPACVNAVKSVVAVVRAVPTVLWVLIFAVSAGLGSVAALVGLTFHSFAYLTKAYAESIEEMDPGVIEALRANGASYWQIVCQAIVPTTITSMIAWTFMRFEINFANAVAMGAAAGAGGIGFNLFMAGSFYFDLHEMGMLTYIVVIAVVLLEMLSTKIKANTKRGKPMEKRRISRILARADGAAVKRLADEIKAVQSPVIVKAPEKSLAMIRMREPVQESLFYLGEVIVCEAIVDLAGKKGVAVLMGDDFDKVLDMAVIDAACNAGVFARYDELERLEREQKIQLEKERAMFLKTMVSFHSMDSEVAP